MADQADLTNAAALLGSKGGAVRSVAKSIRAKLNSKARWATRRMRYGETGRRGVDVRLASRLDGNPPGKWQSLTPSSTSANAVSEAIQQNKNTTTPNPTKP